MGVALQQKRWGFFAFILSAIAIVPLPALATESGNFLYGIIGTIFAAIVSAVGKLLILAVYILTTIAQYNNFAHSAAVTNGWVIVRDVSNMFFIVVLLIIAFATILNVSKYQWKAMLPQLVVAAILINFSKTIAGIFIDLSQVIMLTFVNGFAAAAGGNFVQMFQIRELLSLNETNSAALDLLKIVGGYLLAFVLVTIALITTLIMTVILAFRIVMLWALVVLSPLPYVLKILPGKGSQYASKWWDMFGEYLIVGPVLAFFLWLALVSVGTGTIAQDEFLNNGGAGTSQQEANEIGSQLSSTNAQKPESLLSFVIAISMLIAGLKITGEMKVVGGSMASGAVNKMGSMARGAAYKMSGARYAGALYDLRKKRKEDEFQGRVAKVQSGFGYMQQGIGTGLKYGVGGVGVAAGHAAYGRRAKSAEDRAKQLRQEAAQARDAGDFAGAASKEQAANAARVQAASLRKKQRWTERGVNATVAGVATVATGGAGAVLIPGMFGRGLQGAGKRNVADAKQYTYKKVAGERDAVKNLKPEDVLQRAQGGPGVSKFEQMAAMITAVEKQLVPGADLKTMEAKLRSLGADEKTMSTFQSSADQKYPGTRLSADERRRRVSAGTMPTKDLDAAELASDGGALARDFVLSGTAGQRKDLGQSKTLKAAYQAGLQAAVATTGDPGDRQKLQAELMRLGGDKASGKTAFQASGMGTAALGKALQGPLSSDLLANIEPADLTDPAVIDAIVKNVSPARLSAAIGSAKKPDADPQASVNMAALQSALKDSTSAKDYEAARSPVRGAEADVASVQKQLEKVKATAARTPVSAPNAGALATQIARLTGELSAAQTNLQSAETAFETKVSAMSKTERELYESLRRAKFKK